MKAVYPILFASVALLASCSSNQQAEEDKTEAPAVPTLTVAWETDTTLITPEALIYDPANDVFYVSCIGGMPADERDGDGFIAKVGPDGKIIETKWVTGISSPKGLALSGNILYTSDIDALLAIDVTTGKILSKTPIIGATFLNDTDVDSEGNVYLTDSNQDIVFKVSETEQSIFYQNKELGRLNGVLIEGDSMLLVGSSSGNVFSLKNNELTVLADSIMRGDGIERYKDGHFVSSWLGEVYYLGPDRSKSRLIDTKAENINAADIEVIESKNLLIVPTFFANKLVAYTIK